MKFMKAQQLAYNLDLMLFILITIENSVFNFIDTFFII
jgi:hypothetical protein